MLETLNLIWVAFGYVVVIVFGGLAIWRGGWAERSATIIIWIAWAINPFLQNGYDPGLKTVVVDVLVTGALITISHYSRRFWTIFAAASALAAVMCHMISPFAVKYGYYGFLTILGLVGGIYLAFSLGGAVWEVEYLRKQAGRASTDRDT